MKQEKLTDGQKIGGLFANLFLPGVGSLITRRKTEGVVQLILLFIGVLNIVLLGWFLIGLITGPLILFATWLWAMIQSVMDILDR